MDDKPILFKNIDEVVLKLTSIFKGLDPNDLRDLVFYMQEFRKNQLLPDNTVFYKTTIPVEALEVSSESTVSEVLVEGFDKYKKLNYSKKDIPPVVAIKEGVRQIIIYGENNAIEAYLKDQDVRAIVLEIENQNIFELFNIDEEEVMFLVPLLQKYKK